MTATAADPGKYNVLAIEDDPNIARLLRETMTRAGMVCHTAANGQQGVKAFHETHPHLVLLDLMLPDSTGYAVCAQLRKSSGVPIIMLTARLEPEDQLQGFKLGADDYVTKPFDPKLLLARVVAQLRRSYHYEAAPPPSAETAQEAAPVVPQGWLHCDSCGYMGPRYKFEVEKVGGNIVAACPNCERRLTHVIA